MYLLLIKVLVFCVDILHKSLHFGHEISLQYMYILLQFSSEQTLLLNAYKRSR